jgi:hypothetical protein
MTDKSIFDGNLGFWDYVRIGFYTRFAPKKLAAIGPVRGIAYAMPDGKTFFSASPRLQELRPLAVAAAGPLAKPQASLVPFNLEQAVFEPFVASPELENEYEDQAAARLAADIKSLEEKLRADGATNPT